MRDRVCAATEVHSLSRSSRGRVGVGVPARNTGASRENSPTRRALARNCAAERVDLPGKREWLDKPIDRRFNQKPSCSSSGISPRNDVRPSQSYADRVRMNVTGSRDYRKIPVTKRVEPKWTSRISRRRGVSIVVRIHMSASRMIRRQGTEADRSMPKRLSLVFNPSFTW